MELLVLLLCVLPIGADPKSKAKMVEDYVLSANFDDNFGVPQIRSRGLYYMRGVKPGRISKEDTAESNVLEPQFYHPEPYEFYPGEEEPTGVIPGPGLKERDLDGHHNDHHLLPSLITPYHVLAVGFVSFLILISNLQTVLAIENNLKAGAGGGLLGALTKPSLARDDDED